MARLYPSPRFICRAAKGTVPAIRQQRLPLFKRAGEITIRTLSPAARHDREEAGSRLSHMLWHWDASCSAMSSQAAE